MSEIFKRSHMCGSLRMENVGQEVVLNGWVAKQRNLGNLVFVDLRDRTGITQLTFDEESPKNVFAKGEELRSEFSIGIKGVVRERSSKNKNIPTGDIEVLVKDIKTYSKSETPPIYIKDDDNVDENLRLAYRYLDLRKNKMQENLMLRHRITKLARDYFDNNGFMEIETPMLIKSTPEGARDFLVPSRLSEGKFYALPQSPQLFKQILMVSGCDRYMQIARCFRDEDLRADRQPEFTQIDLEMSYVDQEDVIEMQEGFLKLLFKEIKGYDLNLPLPRLTWQEAMERFGSDKPDLRFGFELRNLTDTVSSCQFKVFTDAIANGGSVRGIKIDDGSKEFSRKDIDKLTDRAKDYGVKGLVWLRIEEGEIKSSVSKFFSQEELGEIAKVFEAEVGDLILVAADKDKAVFDSLGFLRRHIAGLLGLLKEDDYKLLWVVDFPMFERDAESGKLKAMHHPFTHPKNEDLDIIDKMPEKARADAYDIVFNGVELGGGSIRIHEADLQSRMFRLLNLTEEECQEKFGFLLDAFKFGPPPHGGLAYGLDRLVMLFAGEQSIREVMAFPKNQNGECLLCKAPDFVDKEQLEELGLSH